MPIDVILTPQDLRHPPPGAVARHAVMAVGDASDAVAALDGKQFDLVIFGAREFGPPPQSLRDTSSARHTRAYHVPIKDGPLTEEETFLAANGANYASQAFASGENVLVTCMKGENRSPFLVALAYHMLTGEGGAAALRHVRERRMRLEGWALENPMFVRTLLNLAPRRARPSSAMIQP